MAYDPSIFNINPYYDDYDGGKGFLRVLFKPGYALQARELSQLQTILQDQISKIGDHLFKDGSRIVGGGITVRNSSYVRVNLVAGLTDYAQFVGGTISDSSGNLAKIVHYIDRDSTSDNFVVFVVDFISGTVFSGGVTVQKDGLADQAFTIPTAAFSVQGDCKLVTVSDGIFYVDGFFVRVSQQNFTPFLKTTTYRDFSFFGTSLFSALSKKIGFSVTRDNITEQEDPTLRDPSIGSYNYNAPGADRYKIVLVLDQRDLDSDPVDFVELLRFENGKITKKIDKITYGEIMRVLANRTYDESGSYIVRPFDLTVKSNDSSSLLMSIGEGKAYVLGYEVENQNSFGVTFAKARDTQSESSVAYPFSVGNWIGVSADIRPGSGSGGNTGYGDSFANELIKFSSGSARVTFRNAANGRVAEAYVHGAFPNGTSNNHYRLYLFGLSGSLAGASYGHINRHGTGQTFGIFGVTAPPVGFTLYGSDDSSLVYELQPGYAVDAITSFRMVGKIVSNLTPAVTVSFNTPLTGDTRYFFKKDAFTDTIPSSNASAFKFLPYTSNGTVISNTTDIKNLSFIQQTSPVSFTPTSGKIGTNAGDTEVTVEISGAPTGFTGTVSLRVACPIVYTPTLTDSSTFRTKTATVDQTRIISDSINAIRVDERGRRYYDLVNMDVYSIKSVVNTANTALSYTDDFELDDGQRETYYTSARLYIKKSKESLSRYTTNGTSVSMTVTYSYFTHGGLAAAPFIGKHSYTNIPYDQIPLYTNPRTGKTVALANCLDFRRSGLTSEAPMIKPYGRSEFGIGGDSTASYNHFLPRVDKLCVKSDPEDGSPMFFFVQGTPDLAPIAPPDPEDALVLASVLIPAYTHNAEDVVLTPTDNKRYTMSDIGKINKRVDEVEVFTKLSLSESEIEARSIKATPTTVAEPLKTSIFVDEFYGHSVADVNDDNFSCSIDFERGELRPFYTHNPITLPSTPSVSGTTVSSDGLVTLNYSGVTYISNTQYTKTVKINPSNTVNWLGFMKLSVSVDPFYDTGYRPVIKTNALFENDNWVSANSGNGRGFGTQWNDWESIWTGIEETQEEQDDIQSRMLRVPHTSSTSMIPSLNSGNNRVGVNRTAESVNQKTSNFIRARKLKNRIRYSVGSRTVDRSVVPYIPTKIITATVRGLKPSTGGLVMYFDGVAVAQNITTDVNGSCSVTFTIPAGTIVTGNKLVRISNSPTVENSTISAETTYYCTGVLEQRVSGSYSTRPPELRRQTTSSETISKDPFNRDIDSVESIHWSDPLSQTFFVDKKTTPDGIFLRSVTLYFASKDSRLPVTVQIRPTVSGYPSPSVVMPFSTVTLLPSAVVSDSVPRATEFVFSSPVYLEPGEYAICVLANSDDYSLYAADSAYNGYIASGDNTTGRAGNNQLVGTLFTTQGIGPAVADNSTDIMFKATRCEFVSSPGSSTITWSSLPNCTNSQIVKIYAPEIVPSSCGMTRTLGGIGFQNNDSLYFKTIQTSAPDLKYTLTRGSSTTVSPVIDSRAMFATAIKMYATSTTPPTSRYVSRIVELPEALVSNGIAVFLDANLPSGSAVKVYYRVSANGDEDILTRPWVEITNRITPAFTSNSEIDFREAAYRVAPISGGFKAYQIAVEMISTPSVPTYYQTPAVRNIRTVSFIQ